VALGHPALARAALGVQQRRGAHRLGVSLLMADDLSESAAACSVTARRLQASVYDRHYRSRDSLLRRQAGPAAAFLKGEQRRASAAGQRV